MCERFRESLPFVPHGASLTEDLHTTKSVMLVVDININCALSNLKGLVTNGDG